MQKRRIGAVLLTAVLAFAMTLLGVRDTASAKQTEALQGVEITDDTTLQIRLPKNGNIENADPLQGAAEVWAGEELQLVAEINFGYRTEEQFTQSKDLPVGITVSTTDETTEIYGKSGGAGDPGDPDPGDPNAPEQGSSYTVEELVTLNSDNTPEGRQLIRHVFTVKRADASPDPIRFTLSVDANYEGKPSTTEFEVNFKGNGGGGQQEIEDREGRTTVILRGEGNDFWVAYPKTNEPMILPTADELGWQIPQGKVFRGWSGLEGSGAGDGEVGFIPSRRTTGEAIYGDADPNEKHTVTIYPGRAGGEPYLTEVNETDKFVLGTNPENYGFTAPAGYEFAEYELVDGATWQDLDRVVKDISATTVWKKTGAESCTVTYELGTNLFNERVYRERTCFAGNKHTLLTWAEAGCSAPDGKEFKCWKIGEKEYPEKARIEVNANIEVTPVYKDAEAPIVEQGIALCREADRGIVEAPIIQDTDNWAVAPVIGVNKGTTNTYTIKVWPKGDEYWFVLMGQSKSDVAEASVKGNVLTVTGKKAGTSEIELVASPQGDGPPFHTRYKIVVSEIAEQDADASASVAAATALAGEDGKQVAVDDYEITYKSGTVSSDESTSAQVTDEVAEGIIANLAGMEDSLSTAEQEALRAGNAFLYVDAGETDENNVAQAVKNAIENAAGTGRLSFMNIGLFAQLGNCARRAVSEAATEDAVQISVDTSKLAPLAQGATRTVRVIRYHNGAAEVLEHVTLNGAVATFSSSLFSPYAIEYTDVNNGPGNDDAASVTWRYSVRGQNEYKDYKTETYPSFAAAVQAAGVSAYRDDLPEEDRTNFRYYEAPVIKLFKNITVNNTLTMNSDTPLYLDLNGKTLTITKDAKLTGTSDGYPTDISLDSTLPGTVNCCGIVEVAFGMWTGDTFNITGGTVVNGFSVDGGTLNITGGEVNFGGRMINNGGAADIAATISGDARIQGMSYVCYLDDEGHIEEGMHDIMLTLNGGYYDVDPNAYKTGNMGMDDFDQSAYVKMGAAPEAYSGQTDWAADPDTYKWRIADGSAPQPLPEPALTVSEIEDQVYSGAAIKPEPVVKYGDAELVKDVDYTLSYKNNIKAAGKGDGAKAPAVVVTGKGQFKSTMTIPFTIEKLSIRDADNENMFADGFSVSLENKQETGKPAISKPVVRFVDGSGKTVILKEKTDYTLSYKDSQNNTNPKAAGLVTVTVTGTGSFKDSATATYQIIGKSGDQNLKNAVIAPIADQVYTGDAFEQEDVEALVTVWSSKTAQNEGEEPVPSEWYTVSFNPDDTLKTGKVTVSVQGTVGHGELWKTATFKILPKPVVVTEDGVEVAQVEIELAEGEEPVYTGKALKPEVVVTDLATNDIIPASNYTVKYTNNTNAAEEDATKEVRGKEVSIAPTATLTFKGNYKGTLSLPFTIEPLVVDPQDFTVTQADIKDNNKEITAATLKPVVKFGKTTMKKDKDYEIEFDRADGEMQEANVLLMGNYAGEKMYAFRIYNADSAVNLSDGDIFTVTATLAGEDAVYDGTKKVPAITVTALVDGENTALVNGRDYTVSCTNNVYAGKADAAKAPTWKVSGKGAYKGKRTGTFTIDPRPLSTDDFTISVTDMKYNNGKELKAKVTVTDQATKKALKAGKDYTFTYADNKNIPTGENALRPRVILEGKGNYTTKEMGLTNDAHEIAFRIYEKDISSVTVVNLIKTAVYTGSKLEPKGFKVYPDAKSAKEKKNALTEGEDGDYVVEYGENINAGTGTVTLKGVGTYGGTKIVKFTILPKVLAWLVH